MLSRIRIAVVDPHPLFREGISYCLAPEKGLHIVGQGSTADDALQVAQRLRPDVLLFDGSTGDRDIETATLIRQQFPEVKVVIMASHSSSELLDAALAAGASGCLIKDIPGQELARVVRSIHVGHSYIAPPLADLAQRRSGAEMERVRQRLQGLTPREKQVLFHVAEGLTNKEIAQAMHLSEKTVKHYMTAVMEKLHVGSRVEAAMVFLTFQSVCESKRAT